MSHFKFDIEVHKGNTLYELSNVNKSPSEVVIELLQNALDPDVHATHIHVFINAQKGILDCYDDGGGISKDQLAAKWRQIGLSTKRGMKDATGMKGIAILSGLSIAKKWMIITRPLSVPHSRYFRASLLKSNLKDNESPQLEGEDMEAGFGFKGVSFKPTTKISLSGITGMTARELSDLDTLSDEILNSFGLKIRRLQLDIQLILTTEKGETKRIRVMPQEFPGMKQEPVVVKTARGNVKFDIFSTMSPVKSPKILIDHRGGVWQFPASKVKSLWAQTKDVLASGFFQGYIHVDFCTLLPDRQGFEHDFDEEVFVEAVVNFVREYLEPNLEDIRDESKFVMYADVFRSVVAKVDKFLSENPQFRLQAKTQGFDFGEKSASDTSKVKRVRQNPPSIHDSKKRKESEKQKGDSRDGKEKKKRVPPSVQDPSGKSRNMIEGKFGLTLMYEIDESGRKWISENRHGVIVFNVSHPEWTAIATLKGFQRERAYQRFVEMHVCKELAMMLISDPHSRRHFGENFDNRFFTFLSALS